MNKRDVDTVAEETQASPALKDEIEVLKQDLAQIRKDLAGMTSAIKTLAATKVSDARDNVHETANQGRDELQRQISHILAAGKKSMGDLESRIDQQPVASLLTAAAVGYLVARVVGHGDHSEKSESRGEDS